jgi:hypothetical protein
MAHIYVNCSVHQSDTIVVICEPMFYVAAEVLMRKSVHSFRRTLEARRCYLCGHEDPLCRDRLSFIYLVHLLQMIRKRTILTLFTRCTLISLTEKKSLSVVVLPPPPQLFMKTGYGLRHLKPINGFLVLCYVFFIKINRHLSCHNPP